jgi:hypothetical protein
MTVGTAKPSVEYIEDGATILFAVPFQFFNSDELIVLRTTSTVDIGTQPLALGADYTVAGGGGDVGSITLTSPSPLVGATLTIKRHTHRSQLLDYEPGDDFPAESHEEGLDRLEMQIQELEDSAIDAEQVRDIMAATLVAGDGIIITVNDADNTITISTRDAAAFPDCVMLSGDQQTWLGDGTELGAGGLDEQDVKNIVASFIKAGSGITVSYDPVTNLFTVTNDAPGGGSISTEDVQDIVGALLEGANGVTVTYNDAGNTLVIDGGGGTGGGGTTTGTALAVTDENLVENNGHMTLSNGLTEQWGKVNVPANGTPIVYFPVAFVSWANVVGSGGNTDVSSPGNCRITNVTNAGFTVVNNNGDSAENFWWRAIGH